MVSTLLVFRVLGRARHFQLGDSLRSRKKRRWKAYYKDANGKLRSIGYFDDQEAAAHAVNAAIRRAGLEGKRRMNAVVDGRLVPKPPGAHNRKRRREEPAAAS